MNTPRSVVGVNLCGQRGNCCGKRGSFIAQGRLLPGQLRSGQLFKKAAFIGG